MLACATLSSQTRRRRRHFMHRIAPYFRLLTYGPECGSEIIWSRRHRHRRRLCEYYIVPFNFVRAHTFSASHEFEHAHAAKFLGTRLLVGPRAEAQKHQRAQRLPKRLPRQPPPLPSSSSGMQFGIPAPALHLITKRAACVLCVSFTPILTTFIAKMCASAPIDSGR